MIIVQRGCGLETSLKGQNRYKQTSACPAAPYIEGWGSQAGRRQMEKRYGVCSFLGNEKP